MVVLYADLPSVTGIRSTAGMSSGYSGPVVPQEELESFHGAPAWSRAWGKGLSANVWLRGPPVSLSSIEKTAAPVPCPPPSLRTTQASPPCGQPPKVVWLTQLDQLNSEGGGQSWVGCMFSSAILCWVFLAKQAVVGNIFIYVRGVWLSGSRSTRMGVTLPVITYTVSCLMYCCLDIGTVLVSKKVQQSFHSCLDQYIGSIILNLCMALKMKRNCWENTTLLLLLFP